MKSYFPESELIINKDGSIFHLHLRPEQIANKIILVGDPGRVALVASFLDNKESEVESREFRSITGNYKGKRLTIVSTGIGCDNIDIVLNELDALANIDFEKRTVKEEHQTLEIVRIGTCGGLQPHTPIGTYILSEKSIGFDGLINFYDGRERVSDLEFEEAFKSHTRWKNSMGNPYVVSSDNELTNRIAGINDKRIVRGVTIACGGFYGPQGRTLRIPLAEPELNNRIISFKYQNYCVTNFEMESSALAGLSLLLGHKATTICMVIANRLAGEANTGYKTSINDLIQLVLERI